MELTDEQLAVLPEEARTKAWNALWKWRRGRYDAGDDVSREERTLHLMHGYATALLARQRLAAEVEAFLVLLRSGVGCEDDEMVEQIEALEEILEEE